MTRKYCKAYYLKDLRQYSNWVEKHEEDAPDLTDEDIVYLWDDFTVVKSPVIPDKGILFDSVSSEWQEFCKTTLLFEIPEDLRYAYEQPASQNNGEGSSEQTTATV